MKIDELKTIIKNGKIVGYVTLRPDGKFEGGIHRPNPRDLEIIELFETEDQAEYFVAGVPNKNGGGNGYILQPKGRGGKMAALAQSYDTNNWERFDNGFASYNYIVEQGKLT
jgi:hypothetical protein